MKEAPFVETILPFLLGLALLVGSSQGQTSSQIRVLGADANMILRFDTVTTDFQANIVLQEATGQPIPTIEVDSWVLNSPLPEQTGFSLANGSCTTSQKGSASLVRTSLTALGIGQLCASAHLPVVGSYSAGVSLLYGSRRDTYTLLVERRTPPTTFTVTALPVGPLETSFLSPRWTPWAGPLGPSPALPIRLSVAETGGQELRIYAPNVVQFATVGADNSASQARNADLSQPKDDQGRDIAISPDGTIPLHPYETTVITLAVKERPDPGQYRATVRVASKDGASVTEPVDIRVRDSWGWPLIIICLGVLASFLIRQWVGIGRQRAIQEYQLATLVEEVTGDPDVAGDPVVRAWVAQVDRARRGLSLGLPANVDALTAQRDQLIRIIPLLHALERSSQRLPPRLRELIQEKLQGICDVLDSSDQDRFDKANTMLNDARQAYDNAQSFAPLQRRIDGFRSDLEGQPIPEPACDEAMKSLESAEAAIDSGNEQAANECYQKAVQAAVGALVANVEQTVREWTAKLGSPGGTSGDVQEAQAILQDAKDKLGSIQSDSTAGAESLIAAYNTVSRDLQKLDGLFPASGVPRAAGEFRPVPPAIDPNPPLVAIDGKRRHVSSAANRVRRDVLWRDLVVALGVMVVASLVGLQLLWIPNATFGGLNDYITALVWGFGLHQLSETARQAGPAAITSAIESPSPAQG